MAHPVIWPKKSFFYPIGNTPPTCFTQDISPEESGEILLLGSGDPRSILYTIHVEATQDRTLDFTCCDVEPPVHARNIILLSMIMDDIPPINMWSIFYHFYLDQTSYDILLKQCRTLVEASSTAEQWKNSRYGLILQFCTNTSLYEVRQRWIWYLDMDRVSTAEKKMLKTSFGLGMKAALGRLGNSVALPSLRAAGQVFMHFFQTASESYREYWTTGLTKSTFSKSITHPYPNPTFVYSGTGRKFEVHYGTDPLVCFHLAHVLDSFVSDSPLSDIGIETVVHSAMEQFSSWCLSFKSRTDSPGANLVIRYFVGDAISFCQSLHACRESRSTKFGFYANSWGGTQIDLNQDDYGPDAEEKAPLTFNVIDTSNLTDHVGLLNLLVVTIPLLQRKPWSVIYTDSLLRSGSLKGTESSDLEKRVFADIPTLSLFLGVAPSSYISRFTTHSNKHEALLHHELGSYQFYEHLSWRIPGAELEEPAPLLTCDAKNLGDFFFSVYLNMFSEENMVTNFQHIVGNNPRNHADVQNILQKMTTIHYVRGSLVSFFALIKERAEVNWNEAIYNFFTLLESHPGLVLAANNYQDLICQLYMKNLYFIGVLRPSSIAQHRFPNDCFHGWSSVPPISCIVLKVPRSSLKVLERLDPEKVATPAIQCESGALNSNNLHPSIQCIFGDVTVSHFGGEPQVTINEDSKGWFGVSPLIVTFYMPSWILLKAQPAEVRIGLHLRIDPMNAGYLVPILGQERTIFSTNLADFDHIVVVRHRPNNVGEVDRLRNLSYAPDSARPNDTKKKIVVKFDSSGTKATTLTLRKAIVAGTAAAISLSLGAEVSYKPVTDCTVLVAYETHEHYFNYPLPVLGDQCKIRIARKSLYIEVTCPVRPDDDSKHLSLSLSPIARTKDSMNLLNIHYINMNACPPLRFPVKSPKDHWLFALLQMTRSKKEEDYQTNPDLKDRGALIKAKSSILIMFLGFCGQNRKSTQMFALSNDVGIYAVVFVNSIKFDLPSHSVFLDACVVPLFEQKLSKMLIDSELSKLGVEVIKGTNEEASVWKALLPAFAERCRTWKHTENCEYRQTGFLDLVPTLGNPLCSCGKGKDLGLFGTNPQMNFFHSMSTRVAITLLFPYSFDESLNSLPDSSRPGTKFDSKFYVDEAGLSPEMLTARSTKVCANCTAPEMPKSKLSRCAICKATYYCSKACQTTHWKVHKMSCISRTA